MGRKLRVGFAEIEDASSQSSWSGTPLSILQALRRNPDVEVELISPLKTAVRWKYSLLKLRCSLARENYDWRREEGSLRYFAAQIESVFHKRKLDVVFSTSSIPVARLDSSIPSVFWTDAIFHAMDGYYPGKWCERTRRAGRRQEEAALQRCKFASYSSLWAANGAKELTSPDRVKVLPYGPNLRIEHGRDEVQRWIRERSQSSPGKCTLLFVGLDWQRKGGDVAVEAARHLSEAGNPTKLRIIGPPPPRPLPHYVEAVGFLDKQQPDGYKRLVETYRTSDIFILPSRAECSAIVLAEAAAFGLPVLTCDTGGLADYVLNGRNGFRLPVEDNGTLFAEKAKAILEDYEAFAKNAYAEFEERLNWDTSVGLLVELLKRASERRTVLATR
jgi:glycosyltransferase involved in cell wall biosynthesis